MNLSKNILLPKETVGQLLIGIDKLVWPVDLNHRSAEFAEELKADNCW